MHPNFPTSVIRPVTKKIASRHRNSPTFQFAMICLEISPSDHPSFRAERSEVEKSFKVAYKTRFKDFSTTVEMTIFLEISPSDYQSFRVEHSDGEKSFKDAYKTNCKDLSTAVEMTNGQNLIGDQLNFVVKKMCLNF